MAPLRLKGFRRHSHRSNFQSFNRAGCPCPGDCILIAALLWGATAA